MRKIIGFIIYFLVVSCVQNTKKPNKFKTGSFKTVLEYKNITSFAERNDSIQIETYNNVKDTFHIKWVDSFEYILLKNNPKSLLDSTPFHVKITGIRKNSYTFSAYHKGSKFKQKGEAFIIKN